MRNILSLRTGLITFFVIGYLLVSSNLMAQPFAFVTNGNSNTISMIDTTSNTLVSTIPSGGSVPSGIVLSPDGSRAYVANYGSRGVSVIDTVSKTFLSTLSATQVQSLEIAISPDGSHIYESHFFSTRVSVINIENYIFPFSVTAYVGSGPTGIAITPDGSRVYVINRNDATISVISTVSHTVLTTFPTSTYLPYDIAITPDGLRAYVSTPFGMDVINTTDHTIITTVEVEGTRIKNIAITPDGSLVYVATNDSSNVSVIETLTNTVIANVDVGAIGPKGIAITPDGSRVYVTNQNHDNVSVIDILTNTVTTTIAVGSSPRGIAIANIPVVPADAEGIVTVDEGGRVASDDETIVFDVPAGSVSGDTNIQVVVEDITSPDVIVGDGTDPATALALYEFGPDGTTFDPPANLTLKIDVTSLTEIQRNLISIYRHEDTNMDGNIDENDGFVEVDGTNCTVNEEPVDSATFIATCIAPIAHFSTYGIILLLDSDEDGVPDADDMCPLTSALGFDVDNDGCIDSFEGLNQITSTLVAEGAISATMEKSLISKTDAAGQSATKDNLCASINQLEALKNQVSAQTDKKVSTSAAEAVNNYVDSVVSYSKSLLNAEDTCD